MTNKELGPSVKNIDGKKIRETRIALGISQKRLAEKVGVSRYTITNIENGYTGTTSRTLNNLAIALDLKKIDLLK